MAELKSGRWYIQRSDKVEGPFTAGLVSRYILLGRLEMHDRVSQDRQNWQEISEIPGLIPDILEADSDDPLQQERLMAARRWADERLADDRRDEASRARGNERRDSGDRRDLELDELKQHRSLLRGRNRRDPSKGYFTVGLFLTAAIIAVGWAGYYAYQNKPESVVIDCNAVPQPAVNWTNCILLGKDLRSANLENATLRNARLTSANMDAARLTGADMAYVDLSLAQLEAANLDSASLKGANLSGANLRQASLVKADLSFANLTGARLDDVNLAGAKLSKAIWIDGTLCLDDVIGACR